MEEERKKGEKKENSTELQKPNIEAEIYNTSKKCDIIVQLLIVVDNFNFQNTSTWGIIKIGFHLSDLDFHTRI